jgi:hypothetical protein
MKLGNLDNLSFGMGLVAKSGQVVPAKNARLEGFDTTSMQNVSPLLVIVGIIILARIIW